MNKSTRVIDVIEMTREESYRIWGDWDAYKKHGIRHWNTADGNNEIRFEGEDFYRPVCYVEDKS